MAPDPRLIAPAQRRRRVLLTAGWESVSVMPGAAETPHALATLGALPWHSVAEAQNGTLTSAIAHPQFAGDHDAYDWWFRCRFTHDDLEPTSQYLLTLGGLATLADVWLNDTHLLHSSNMFLAHDIDVTNILHRENELIIRCASVRIEVARRRPRPAWRTKLVEHQQLRWIRTTLLGRMPGWSASPQIVGPWRPVAIEQRSTITTLASDIRPALHGDTGTVDVSLRIRTIDATLGAALPRATVHVGEHDAELTARADSDDIIISGTVRLPHVRRWWPHTHGEQPRYDVTISLEYRDETTRIDCGRVAFRTVMLDRANDNFAVSINDTPVFCRGACWSTVDARRLHGTREEYRAALALAKDAGMNMIRVGGTMTYEADDFYDLCDEMGILIWQDFMFANMDYPLTDETFAATVQNEIAQFLQRTQQHASIAILCGNNEIQQQVAMLGLPRERWTNPFFQEPLPALCHARRPDVPYWPSSPSGGTFPFHANAGDTHYFGFGPYLRTFDDVRSSDIRFASETLAFAHVPDQSTIDLLSCGTAGAGHHPVWKATVPRDNGATWDFEDVRDHYLAQFFNQVPAELRRTDTERYLALGRVTSGEAIARAMGEWRRANSRCNGALLWFYRDLYPGAGWGIVDATGRPKAAYYFFKRAAAPVAILLANDGLNGISFTVANDRPDPLDATVRVTTYRHGEIQVASADLACTVPPHSRIAHTADALFEGFSDLSYAYRFGPPNHDLIVASLIDSTTGTIISESHLFPVGFPNQRESNLGIAASAIAQTDGTYRLRVSTRRFAQSIAINTDHFLADDNYFHLAPGATKEIILRPFRSAERPLSGTVEPLNGLTSTRIEQ